MKRSLCVALLIAVLSCLHWVTPALPNPGKTFEWQMENSSTADFSVGDTSGSQAGTTAFDGTIKQSGSYSLKVTGGGFYQWSIASLDIITNSGSTQFYVYFDSIAANQSCWAANLDGNNYINTEVIDIAGTKYIRLYYKGAGNAVATSATAGTAVTTGQWYKITARWRTGATDPSLSLQVDSGTASTDDTDLTAWATTSGNMLAGADSSGLTFYLDNLTIWDSWTGPDAAPAATFNAKPLLGVGR